MVILSRIMGILTGSPGNLFYFISLHVIGHVAVGIDMVHCNFITVTSGIISTIQHLRMRSRTGSTKWVIIRRGPRRIVLITQWWFPFQFFRAFLLSLWAFLAEPPSFFLVSGGTTSGDNVPWGISRDASSYMLLRDFPPSTVWWHLC